MTLSSASCAISGQGGEVAVCVFQQTEGVPLAPSFLTLMVESVSSYLSEVIDLDGRVLLPESPVRGSRHLGWRPAKTRSGKIRVSSDDAPLASV
jgi:hypothetical protein